MVLSSGDINIIADMEGTTGIKLHNNKQKLRNRFDIVRKLGQGTYGKVQLAVNKDTGEEVAIKTIRKSKIETEQDLVRIQREIQIMSSVQHPHIIHIYEVFENKEKIVLVMEYASGGELYDYLSYKKFLEEHEARRVFRQVAAAVYYCHKNMICHRDLKLENILLDEKGNAKIADFGLSNVFDDKNFLNTFCGSPLYASPEIVQGTPYYGPEVDCWSLGVLLYTLVYGAMPFDGSNFKRLVKQISEGDYYEPKELSDASSLIRKMLTVSSSKRATVDDICNDEWVDTGEEIALVTIAQEFCNQMPVRLDYLLALTSGADPELPPVDEAIIDKQTDLSEKITENNDKLENNAESELPSDNQQDIKPNNELTDTQIELEKEQISLAGTPSVKAEAEETEIKPEVIDDAIPVVDPSDELSKEVADNEKATTDIKEKSVGVKRISSFGKKSITKTPITKSKTNTEPATKLNGVANKFGRLKKSGSESEGNDNKVTAEKKPWAPATQKSSSMKISPLPTSPTTKYSTAARLTKTGSLDKPDDKSTSEVNKPPLRGTRVGSPVKQFHDSNHHKGCAPGSESQKAAQTEAKKSPSKSVLNKRASPGPTREVSPKKYPSPTKPSPTQRDRESPKKQIGVRPRSPVKTIKPTKSTPCSSPAESGEIDVKPISATEKRGSIDIAPLPTPPVNADGDIAPATEQKPQVTFMPKDKGGFTLIGVKSEVMFDVDNSKEQNPPIASVEIEKSKKADSDKIIKYVATVKKHGKDLTKPENEAERVTLLNLKCSPSEDEMSEVSTVATNDSSKEQRGYNVYRSKYKSIQKFRSVVEHQVGRYEDETEVHHEESDERKESADVEHCDSFSSAGSNDDLEDVFESLNSESLFSSLLNRTRSLMQRLSTGHIGITANSSGSSTFSFSSPGISVFLTRNGQSQRSSVSSENTGLGSRRYGRSTSRSSQDSEQLSHRRYLDDNSSWERRSRYEDFMASSRMREDPGRELMSSFLRNRNPSLDTARRPRSYYGSVTTGCLPGTGRSRDDLFSSAQDKSSLDQYHYTKSYSRQVSEESVKSSSTQSSKLQRPRSFNSGNNHSSAGSGSSVHRDYNRSVSQTGGKSLAEEEEVQHEHHISEDKNQRSEIKKDCKRSVSISESRVSSLRKDDSLSRQDSGIESMYDVNSPTSGVADKSTAGRPPPVKEEDNSDHPLSRKHRSKTEDEDDDNSSVSHETGSVGSDSTCNDYWANSTSPSHISPSRNDEEESVSDRIRRKSFYARFNDTRSPRSKARKQNSGLQPQVPSNSHLRQLLMETDPFLESRNSHYDSFHQGEHFTHHRSPSQRWSMHLHSPTGSGMPEGMADYFSPNPTFNIQPENSSTLPRRSSFTGASSNEDHSGAGPSMARTHSLPEDNVPPDNNGGSTSYLHSTGSLRRPRRLDLYDRNVMDDTYIPGRRPWKQYSMNPSSSSSFRDSLEPWDTPHYTGNRQTVGNQLSSLMDSLESPSDVLQKAMELCDSLRKVK